jgi:hypothetical protein
MPLNMVLAQGWRGTTTLDGALSASSGNGATEESGFIY